MSEQLKPCPFCGEADALRVSPAPRDLRRVFCIACGCLSGCTVDGASAIEKWNRRAPSPSAVVKALEKELAEWDAKNPDSTSFNNGYLSALRKTIKIVKELS